MLGLLLNFLTPSTVLVMIVVGLLTYYFINTPYMLKMPPGPFPLPVVGNFFQLFKKPPGSDFHAFLPIARQYGKIITLQMGAHKMVFINDHKLLIEAYVKQAEVFSLRPIKLFYVMQYVNEQFGTGIITSDGPVWKQVRRTALTTMRDFGVGKQSLEERILEEVRVLLNYIEKKNGEPFYTKPLFNLATSNVICNVIFGSRFDYSDEKFKELLRVLDNSLSQNPLFIPVNFFPYLKYIPFFKRIVKKFTNTLRTTTEYVKELTKSNEETFDPDNIRDFVDLFIKSRKEHEGDEAFDDRTMRRVIVDLFTAGSDTTANSLSWATLFMAAYPEIQKRCQKEIEETIGKGKQPTSADKGKLPFVEATILEVLRLRPAAPFGVPHCTGKATQLGGYYIPKDTIVTANLFGINRDPEVFENPDEFDPNHFLDQDGKVTHKDRMMSFSAGPRTCLGEILARQELSLFFTAILQNFTITPEPGKTLDMKPGLALVLRHSVQNIVFTRRE